MSDLITKEKRSKIMQSIRAKGNKTTELALMRIFRENRVIGWRRNIKLVGKPDFVFPKSKLVVFVDGCFWHGHWCQKPRESQEEGFWKNKIAYNKRNDRKVNRILAKKNWTVVRIWECEIRKGTYFKKLNRVKEILATTLD
jgi:DNA mismatch endonuclease, patch repair protein